MSMFRFGAIALLSTLVTLPLSTRAAADAPRPKQQTQQIYFLLDRCQPALSQRVGGRVLIAVDTLRDYFISNAENGLTGQGSLDAAGGFRQFTFDCRVNIRDGRVTGVAATFVGDPVSPSNPNPPSGEGVSAIVDTPNGQPIPLRYGPGTEYFVIETVPDGRSLRLNGRSSGDWVQTSGGAWVYRPYLRLIP